ncbi:MAG: serine hydrolase domain-containing protein [Alphaproteobacteria bacterium]
MKFNWKRSRRGILCLLLASVTAMPQGYALPARGTGTDRFESIRELIRRKLADGSAPSIAVAVSQHGKIVWEEGFGWADKEKKILATENTMYSLASVSKPFTTTGLMTLVQAGKINLDKPIDDYLGEAKLKGWAGDAREATVRRVANHSSGLPLHAQFFVRNGPYPVPSDDDTIRHYGNIVTVPGQHFQYSNIAYGILGFVASRVSGQSYADFMRDAVFRKLGLTHTSIDVEPGLEAFAAIRYDEKGKPIPLYDSDHPGACAVYSSAHDLVRFGMFHLKDHLAGQAAILSDASIDEMHRSTMNTGTARTNNGNGYGFGWGVGDNRADGYHTLAHGGGMAGVSTELILVPSEDIAVAVLINARDNDSAYPLANAILKVLLPKWQMPVRPQPAQVPFRPDATLLGTWSGTLHTYQGEVPAVLTVLPGGEPQVKLGNGLTSLINQPQFQGGELTGQAWGDLGIDDARHRQAYTLSFDLRLQGGVMSGPVSATSVAGDAVNRGSLTQWLELRKQ